MRLLADENFPKPLRGEGLHYCGGRDDIRTMPEPI